MRGRSPPGIQLVRTLLGRTEGRRGDEERRLKRYRLMVLILTFVAYACYHASRKPPSIVKSVLDPAVKKVVSAAAFTASYRPWPLGDVFVHDGPAINEEEVNKGWAPFDGPGGTAKLGEIDLAFLSFYSVGMYAAGHLGDRLDLRLFLAVGMAASGCFVGLFGMGYFWDIHAFWYYLATQMLAGLFQATGWPSVVAVVGNWFGDRKRGLIMGIWNAHTSVGNISGSLLAASVLQYGWGWSFILPGGLIAVGGVLIYMFLVAYPEDLGLPCPHRGELQQQQQQHVEGPEQKDEETGQVVREAAATEVGVVGEGRHGTESNGRGRAVGILQACMIPGVIPFALCLFFSKLVAYTFLYWLPFYLSQTAIGGEYMSVKSAGNLSTLFDVGGIAGGILAGYISDQLNARAITAASFMYLAIPSLYAYHRYGGISQSVNIVLMMIAGLFVNGPYALITTAVSADLGTHSSLKGDSRALATVTAIIDGTGSAGAALGPLLTGFISSTGWGSVFVMLMVGAFVAGALLSFLIKSEIREMMQNKQKPSNDGVEGSAVEPLLRQGT